jgi:hypothetical protein
MPARFTDPQLRRVTLLSRFTAFFAETDSSRVCMPAIGTVPHAAHATILHFSIDSNRPSE